MSWCLRVARPGVTGNVANNISLNPDKVVE